MSTALEELRESLIEMRDALIERSAAYAAAKMDSYAEQFRKLSEVEASRLAALDALIAERDTAKARAEKAEAGMKEQCDTCEIKCVFDADRRFAERCKAENDALRKALEPFAEYAKHHGCYNLQGRNGAYIAADHWVAAYTSVRGPVIWVDDNAALHGTAKPEQPPADTRYCKHEELAKNPNASVPRTCPTCKLHKCAKGLEYPAQPKPTRTCGECKHWDIFSRSCCVDEAAHIFKAQKEPSCSSFQPRADAQKEGNA